MKLKGLSIPAIWIAVSATGLGGADSGSPAGSSEPRVRVFVTNRARVPGATLRKAQELASGVYLKAGIELDWRACPSEDCQSPFRPLDLFLHMLATAHPGLGPEAKAFGMAVVIPGAFSDWAYVFHDRVSRCQWDGLGAATQPLSVTPVPAEDRDALLLGVVMAHELGHLLLGSKAHTATGIMRPEWKRPQLEDAYAGRQGFRPSEISRLQENVQARARATRPREP